jgi:hypothetical protein
MGLDSDGLEEQRLEEDAPAHKPATPVAAPATPAGAANTAAAGGIAAGGRKSTASGSVAAAAMPAQGALPPTGPSATAAAAAEEKQKAAAAAAAAKEREMYLQQQQDRERRESSARRASTASANSLGTGGNGARRGSQSDAGAAAGQNENEDNSSLDGSFAEMHMNDKRPGKGGKKGGEEDGLMPISPMLQAPASSGAGGTPSAGSGGSSSLKIAPTSAFDLTDFRRFLTSPVTQGVGVVQCTIERDRSSLASRIYPTYHVSLKDGERFLLSARKRGSNKTSNYLVSMDKRDLNRDSAAFLGKLRANFVGTEFIVYDDGVSPEKAAKSKKASTNASVRQELAVVNYASNVLGSRGPRKMKVGVPKVDADGKRIVFQPLKDEDGMQEKVKCGHTQDMVLMINKPPKWNTQVGAYVLNFNGRVTMASVKNFQLVSPDDHDTVLLQFGRTGKDSFSMDFQWPLSPMQAFAICLSSFDFKLVCE